MRKWLILLSLLSVTRLSAAPVWTWVDNQGQVHYSDRPVEGARQIDLPEAQRFPAFPRPPSRSSQTSSDETARGATSYSAFNILSPADQETLWNIGGNLNVQLELLPGLQAGHQIDLLLDGQRANLNVRSLTLTVPNAVRGMHSVQAVVIDANGRELLRSPAVSFVIQQTSTQNPNSRLAPRGPAAPNGN